MTFTSLPPASLSQAPCPSASCFTGSNSKYPLGLSSSAVRTASVTTSRPPSASIFIIMDVPERGSPETTMIGAFFAFATGDGDDFLLNICFPVLKIQGSRLAPADQTLLASGDHSTRNSRLDPGRATRSLSWRDCDCLCCGGYRCERCGGVQTVRRSGSRLCGGSRRQVSCTCRSNRETGRGLAARRLVILQFDSVEQARAWLDSPDCAPVKKLRHQSASTNMVVIEGA